MFKKALFLFVAISFLALSGCALNAGVQQMVPQNPINQKPKNAAFINAIYVADVKGGKETNPLWTPQINNENYKLALEQALQRADLYHTFSGAKYQLNTDLISLKQPLIGINYTVKLEVQYTLIDLANKRTLLNKKIESSYKAGLGDSPLAVVRMKKANEGAARENIKALIAYLYENVKLGPNK